MNVLFVQGKGGVGKSTLAFLLAITLHKAGKTVGILDLDPQRSLTAWLHDTTGFPLRQEGEIIIVDTPPRIDDPLVLEAIRKADRIIIPTTPSPAELATLRHSAGVVESSRKPSSKALIVFNRVKKVSTYGRNLSSMAANLPLPAAQSSIADREIYKHVLLDGWTALDAQAKNEVMSLALEIQ